MIASAVEAVGPAVDEAVIEQALRLLEARMRVHGPLPSSPEAVRGYCAYGSPT